MKRFILVITLVLVSMPMVAFADDPTDLAVARYESAQDKSFIDISDLGVTDESALFNAISVGDDVNDISFLVEENGTVSAIMVNTEDPSEDEDFDMEDIGDFDIEIGEIEVPELDIDEIEFEFHRNDPFFEAAEMVRSLATGLAE